MVYNERVDYSFAWSLPVLVDTLLDDVETCLDELRVLQLQHPSSLVVRVPARQRSSGAAFGQVCAGTATQLPAPW